MSGTKQFVWCSSQRCEERDGSGSLTKQFFGRGQRDTITPANYFYSVDHLGSIREMTNSAGSIVWQQSFDPYGQPTTLVSATASDFGYAGYYLHQRSGLSLTMFREYNPGSGRWLSRDPIGEDAGSNLYTYTGNDPILWNDPFGLDVRIYASPGFGNEHLIHVFAYGTEAEAGAGRGGSYGSDLGGRIGYPKDFTPDNPAYSGWPYNTAKPNADGTYGRAHLSESEFINFLRSDESGLNSGPFLPYINDCHSTLKRGFNRAGAEYPGSPLSRLGRPQ